MRQTVSIKKVNISSEGKVTLISEFLSKSKEAKDNLFRLLEMQGESVSCVFEPAQMGLVNHPSLKGEACKSLG